MLGVSSYPSEYVDACRAGVRAQLAAHHDVTAHARGGEPGLAAAIEAFEPLFFNHMVLALDMYFCHRLRGKEGKDGNPLNEVRMLCGSITHNDGVLAADKTIKYKPADSVLGYEIGDAIKLDAGDFARLAEAFFAGIEARFPEEAAVGS